jgi:hypothetical protein
MAKITLASEAFRERSNFGACVDERERSPSENSLKVGLAGLGVGDYFVIWWCVQSLAEGIKPRIKPGNDLVRCVLNNPDDKSGLFTD